MTAKRIRYIKNHYKFYDVVHSPSLFGSLYGFHGCEIIMAKSYSDAITRVRKIRGYGRDYSFDDSFFGIAMESNPRWAKWMD